MDLLFFRHWYRGIHNPFLFLLGPSPSPTDILGSLNCDEPYKIPDEVWDFPRDRLYIRQRIGEGLMGEVSVRVLTGQPMFKQRIRKTDGRA